MPVALTVLKFEISLTDMLHPLTLPSLTYLVRARRCSGPKDILTDNTWRSIINYLLYLYYPFLHSTTVSHYEGASEPLRLVRHGRSTILHDYDVIDPQAHSAAPNILPIIDRDR